MSLEETDDKVITEFNRRRETNTIRKRRIGLQALPGRQNDPFSVGNGIVDMCY